MSEHSDQEMDYDDHSALNRTFTMDENKEEKPAKNLTNLEEDKFDTLRRDNGPVHIEQHLEPKNFHFEDESPVEESREYRVAAMRRREWGNLYPQQENENSEEENIIRLPSDQNESPEVPLVQERSNSESMSNFFTTSQAPSVDCLNFSQQNRELVYMKHADIIENWKYTDEERAFLRHRVEMFSREQCILHCILGHMLMTPEEMTGTRNQVPKADEARQALLSLAIGSHWDVYNLAIIMIFSEKLNMDTCINKTYRGIPLHSPAHLLTEDYRARIEMYFARCLLDD